MTHLNSDIDCHICGNDIINEPQIILVNGCKRAHANCMSCSICGIVLGDKCYEVNGKYLCPDDYMRKKFPTCLNCKQVINPTDSIYYAASDIPIHQHCFKCSICEVQLITGDKYMFSGLNKNDHLILCQIHFNLSGFREKSDSTSINDDKLSGSMSFYSSFNNLPYNYVSPTYCDEELSDADQSCDDICSSDDRNYDIRRRTPRTTIKASELDSLKATFEITPKPSRQMREQLAECTGLSMRVIQVWFQNRRSKERRCKLNVQKKLKFQNKNDKTDLSMKQMPDRNNVSGETFESSLLVRQFHSKSSSFLPNIPISNTNNQYQIDYSNSIAFG